MFLCSTCIRTLIMPFPTRSSPHSRSQSTMTCTWGSMWRLYCSTPCPPRPMAGAWRCTPARGSRRRPSRRRRRPGTHGWCVRGRSGAQPLACWRVRAQHAPTALGCAPSTHWGGPTRDDTGCCPPTQAVGASDKCIHVISVAEAAVIRKLEGLCAPGGGGGMEAGTITNRRGAPTGTGKGAAGARPSSCGSHHRRAALGCASLPPAGAASWILPPNDHCLNPKAIPQTLWP
jgi:hypothetical protein